MQVMAAAGVIEARVEAAFAAVSRERFLGPRPWPMLRWREPAPRYVTDADVSTRLPTFNVA